MRTRGLNVQQILLGLALLAALVWNLAHAAEVRAVQLGSGPTGTRAEVRVDQEAGFRLISLQNPDRLVVDLPGSRAAASLSLPPAAGVVKAVRAGQPVAGTTRIVFDLAAPVVALKPRFESGPDGTRLVIEWPGDGHPDPIAQLAAASTAAASSPAQATSTPAASGATADTNPAAPRNPATASAAATSRLVAELRAAGQIGAASASQPASVPQPESTDAPPVQQSGSAPAAAPAVTATASAPAAVAAAPAPAAARTISAGSRPLVIAIDAGHGGQDPGAIGPSGKREKDITLAIA